MANITRRNPFLEPFEDMDRFFSDAFPALRGFGEREHSFMPAVDMYEDKDNVIVEAQLAGMDPKNVDVSIENDVLTIKGKSEKKNEVDDKDYYKKEIVRGSFYRNVPMPTSVDGDNAKAEYEEGVLKISVPKVEEKRSHKIEIEDKSKK